ncbi:MAG TPA: hypothetical protein VLX09_17585 [Stellaceae bacterium]|nr:hypothetical protein [Stellaceae bacterium]
MPSIAEILRSLYGAWRLLVVDRHGILAFDGTRSAALRSFWVAIVVLPVIIALDVTVGQDDTVVAPHGIWLLLANCVLRWVLPLIVFYWLIRWYGRGDRYWLLVAALNWSQIPQILLSLLETGLFLGAKQFVDLGTMQGATEIATIAGGAMALSALLVHFIVINFYEWFVAWIALEAGFALPTAVLLFDLVIGNGIDYGFDHFLPVLAQSAHVG